MSSFLCISPQDNEITAGYTPSFSLKGETDTKLLLSRDMVNSLTSSSESTSIMFKQIYNSEPDLNRRLNDFLRRQISEPGTINDEDFEEDDGSESSLSSDNGVFELQFVNCQSFILRY